jgi:hypothetical protein
MFCVRCKSLFEGDVLRDFEDKPHYPRVADLRISAEAECFVCRHLWERALEEHTNTDMPLHCNFTWRGVDPFGDLCFNGPGHGWDSTYEYWFTLMQHSSRYPS